MGTCHETLPTARNLSGRGQNGTELFQMPTKLRAPQRPDERAYSARRRAEFCPARTATKIIPPNRTVRRRRIERRTIKSSARRSDQAKRASVNSSERSYYQEFTP